MTDWIKIMERAVPLDAAAWRLVKLVERLHRTNQALAARLGVPPENIDDDLRPIVEMLKRAKGGKR